MRTTAHLLTVAIFSLGLTLSHVGCENLPGTARSQGAVIGGVAGAAFGASVAKENRLLGGLIGAALGAGGGYLIGTTMEKADADEEDRAEAIEAARKAQNDPATASEALAADTADINSDGFVTLDEVVAMNEAGFDDDEMIRRLEATDQVFELADEQEDYLRNRGVSQSLIDRMERIRQGTKESILSRSRDDVDGDDLGDDVIGDPID